jgi:hypothetical protein
MACNVENGVLLPDSDTINQMVEQFESDMKNVPERRAYFKKNPAGYLGQMGFNGDLQREVLNDAGVEDVAALLDTCWYTCICSSCCVTSIETGIYREG